MGSGRTVRSLGDCTVPIKRCDKKVIMKLIIMTDLNHCLVLDIDF